MTQTLSATEYFIEQMGLITQADGGPRIAGRIMGLLIVEGRPFSLAEMAERLKISKASASTNARLLAKIGTIHQTSRAGDRQDYYEVGDNPYPRMMEAVTARMSAVAAMVREAESRFPASGDDDGPRSRVHELAQFYTQSAEFLAEWTKQNFPLPPASAEAGPSTVEHNDN